MISVSFFNERNNINEVINKIDKSSADYIHVDIADNILVPNCSLNDDLLINILSKTNKLKDIHLMVSDVKKYVDLYKKLMPLFITIHVETDNVLENIKYIKSLGIKVGLAVDLDTDIELIDEYLSKVDLLLLMSVKAGFGGQKFHDISDKIKYVRERTNALIEIDGGINDTNFDLVDADIKVVGSFITNSDNYEEQISKLV